MPANLISAAVAWLASHLVLLSLLGFLVAGLFVFGLIGAPGDRPAADAGPATLDHSGTADGGPGPASPLPSQRHPAATPAVPGGSTEATLQSREPGRKPPRLIGGSLPIYEQPRFIPPAGAEESFRPPYEGGVADSAPLTRDDLLQQARRAFWNGDFEAAEAAYMALISEYPADADAFGELGNLYQSMGKQALALDAYYEAAIRLRAAGEHGKMKDIIDLFSREGDARVDQLGR